MSRITRIAGLLLAGWIIFAAASFAARWLASGRFAWVFDDHPTLAHFLVKSTLILVALVMIARSRRGGFAQYGFKRPSGKSTWMRWLLLGSIPGVLVTGLILLTPAKGLTQLAAFGVPGIVLSVWLYSSIAEEIYVRGWLQTALGDDRRSIWLSAAFFSSMHLSLIWIGIDIWTIGIILPGTFVLGYLCARLRARHHSLLPAITAHIGFNVGGFLLAILVNVVWFVVTGHPVK